MLETNQIGQLGIEVQDTTVAVRPGAVRVGNTIMDFPGGRVQFDDISDFNGDASTYQYSALLIQNFQSETDLTSAVSATASSELALTYPVTDSSKHALALFTFWSGDGTAAELVSYSDVV